MSIACDGILFRVAFAIPFHSLEETKLEWLQDAAGCGLLEAFVG
jgi:hypothetical protein